MNAHPFLFEDSFQASCELPILPAPASLSMAQVKSRCPSA